MSQEKVDRYKKEKANRKKIMARQKVKRIIGIACGWVILLAIVGWAGVSAYNIYDANRPIETFACDTTAIDEYLNTLPEVE